MQLAVPMPSFMGPSFRVLPKKPNVWQLRPRLAGSFFQPAIKQRTLQRPWQLRPLLNCAWALSELTDALSDIRRNLFALHPLHPLLDNGASQMMQEMRSQTLSIPTYLEIGDVVQCRNNDTCVSS